MRAVYVVKTEYGERVHTWIVRLFASTTAMQDSNIASIHNTLSSLRKIILWNFFSMVSVDAIAKEWLAICLSKPGVLKEMEDSQSASSFTKSEEYRLTFETEARDQEVRKLKAEQERLSETLRCISRDSAARSSAIDAKLAECVDIERKCQESFLKRSLDSEVENPTNHRNSSDNPLEAHMPPPLPSRVSFVFPQTRGQAQLQKAEQKLLSSISAGSSSLADLISSACESSMRRTRELDQVMDTCDSGVVKKEKHLKEIGDLRSQIFSLRKEHDSQVLDDFNTLVDLALTVEALEEEIEDEHTRQSKSGKSMGKRMNSANRAVVAPIRESTLRLQEQVALLSAEVVSKGEACDRELRRSQAVLKLAKSNQVKTKSHFQQNLKSLFKDFDFLIERVNKCEQSLEKVNAHYNLDEEDLTTVVAPILEAIDSVKENVDELVAEAESAFYDHLSSVGDDPMTAAGNGSTIN